MSYDGFYGNLSTRGSVTELLNQANNIKVSIEASAAEVAADTLDVDWKHAEVTSKAAQVQTDANLVSTKAQEVQDNADYVAGAVANSSLVVIDDTAGLGTTNVTWSADKSSKELNGKVDKVTGKGLSESDYTTAEKTKLAGVAVGATKNATDDQLRDRATHAGAQAISTITGLQGELDSKVNSTSLGTAATKNVGTHLGEILEVGAFGVGHTFTKQVFDANEIADQVGNKSGFYPYVSDFGSSNIPYPLVYINQLFYSESGVEQFAYGFNSKSSWIRARFEGNWSPWIKQLSTNDMLQATGVSTELPMSQAATTSALSGKVDKEPGKGLSEANFTQAEQEVLGQVQLQGAASWSTDGAPYPINAQVYHNGKQWLALRANSVAPTEGADWSAWDGSLRQDLANPGKGAAMVGFKQGGVGVVPRTTQEKLREFVSVKDFGAIGDGIADDTLAFQSALVSGGRVHLYIPPGVYRLTAPVVSQNRNLTIEGAGKDVTVLVWEGSTDGFVLTDDVGFSSNLRANFNLTGMTIATKGAGGDGIRCVMTISKNTPTVYGDASSLTLRDVDIRGYDQYISNQNYWTSGVSLLDTGGVCFDNVRIMGASAVPISRGVYIEAVTASNIRFMFTNLQINFVGTAIIIEGKAPYTVEGIYLTNFEIVACRFGVLVRGGSCHALELVNGHIDTDAEVVKFEPSAAGSSALSLSGCYLQRGDKATGAPMAGYLIDASYCNRARIVSNYLLGDTRVEHHGILIDHSTGGIVALNEIHNVTGLGVLFGANSTRAKGVLNNFTGSSVNYVFSGLNNYADDTDNATYISTAAGLTHAFGTAVVTLNANGEGYVPLPTPFRHNILSSVVCNGYASAFNGSLGSTLSLSSKTAIHVKANPNPGAIVVRVNYQTVGR